MDSKRAIDSVPTAANNPRTMASSPSWLRGAVATTHRQHWLAPLAVVLALLLSACENSRTPTAPRGTTATLVVSEAWRSGATDEEAAGRIDSLQRAIDELREVTGTGWIGRQDDVTGYLADLSGGSRLGSPEDFMEAHGPALFGIDSSVLDLATPDIDTVPGMVSTRATQTVGSVPVRDAVLLFTSRAGSAPSADQLTGVRGRVFSGLTVGTEPKIARRDAALVAAEAAGGTVRGRTRLVVVPNGPGLLAWEVTIVGGSVAGSASALYYVDALTGSVVDVRPTSVGTAPSLMTAEPDPNSVEVTGVDPFGTPRTAYGLRTVEGVAMTDTTTEAWDSTTRKGDVSTYDATGVRDFSQLPGRLATSPDTVVRDPDVLAAQAYVRQAIDYFEAFGRNSWDDKGGSMVASVNFGAPDFCNAMFTGTQQLLFGNPCVLNGEQLTASSIDIDTVGHEVTHGVTTTSAGLVYSGPSGALDESFSDYFGNVIGNLSKGEETNSYAEDACTGMQASFRCQSNPDGTVSQRYLLNGNGLDQYLRLLNLGPRMMELIGYDQDFGGVHYNSAILNNALWSIRTQLARIDDLPGNESPLAQSFDRAVYGALVTRLGPTSGFLDARAAVEQVIIDSGLDPVVLRIAREVFDANNFCAGCVGSDSVAGDQVAAGGQSELHPAVSGDRVTWLDYSASNYGGQVGSGEVSGAPATLGSSGDVLEVGFAGDAVVSLHMAGQIRRTDPSGAFTVLATGVNPFATVAGGFAGSDAGAAWAASPDSVSFVDPVGNITQSRLPALEGDTISSVATGGGYVAAATRGGKVFGWRPGDQPRQVGTMAADVLSLATYAGNVLAISSDYRARLFASDGREFHLADAAVFYLGAAMSSEYAVWAEDAGALDSAIAPETFPDTDLFVLSLTTGKVYNLFRAGGQQGFPALSGRRLVWQDSGLGGDDVRTLELPSGL